jgi:hypothetical protein
LWFDFACFARAGPGSPRILHARVLFQPVSPSSPVFWSQGTYGSLKFPENPTVPLPCSWTPAEPWCLAFTAPRCCPPSTERGGPRQPWRFRSSMTWLQHSLFTLRAAITGDYAKLASGVWPVFPGWDCKYPLSSVEKFVSCDFPFSWASLTLSATSCLIPSTPPVPGIITSVATIYVVGNCTGYCTRSFLTMRAACAHASRYCKATVWNCGTEPLRAARCMPVGSGKNDRVSLSLGGFDKSSELVYEQSNAIILHKSTGVRMTSISALRVDSSRTSISYLRDRMFAVSLRFE